MLLQQESATAIGRLDLAGRGHSAMSPAPPKQADEGYYHYNGINPSRGKEKIGSRLNASTDSSGL